MAVDDLVGGDVSRGVAREKLDAWIAERVETAMIIKFQRMGKRARAVWGTDVAQQQGADAARMLAGGPVGSE